MHIFMCCLIWYHIYLHIACSILDWTNSSPQRTVKLRMQKLDVLLYFAPSMEIFTLILLLLNFVGSLLICVIM